MKDLNIFALLKFALVAIGVGACLLLFSGPAVTEGPAAIEKFRESSQMNFAIWFTIGILIFGIAVVVGFFIWSIVIQPKKTLMSIIGLLVCVVVYSLFSALGTSDTIESLALKGDKVTQGMVNTTSAGIYTIAFCLIAGFIVIIFSPLLGRYRSYKK